jgi:hypothetical protein
VWRERAFHVAVLTATFGLAFRAAVIALPTETLTARYLADDYFYYLGVAANLADGNGSSFDGGVTRTNGYQPLFLWSLVATFLSGAGRTGAIHVGLALQAIAAAVAALLAFHCLFVRDARWAGAAAAGLLSLNLFFVLPTLTGFEMAFALAAMLLALAAWDRNCHPFLVGLLCGFSVLARVDTLVMAGVFAVAMATQRRLGDIARFTLGVALVAGPVALWNAIAFGHPLPDSGVIKAHYRGVGAILQAASAVGLAVPRILLPGRVVDWCLSVAPLAIWLLAAIILLICGRAAWRRENRVLGALAVGFALPYIALIDPQETGALVRYFYPVWAILAMLMARSFRPAAVALLVVIHALDVTVYARWDRATLPAPSFVGSAHVLAPAVIERTVPPGQLVGSFDAGALGYFSPRPVINLDGLANHEIVELRRTCRVPYEACLREYLRAKGISVLAGGTGFGWTGHFHDWKSWERLYQSPPLIDGSQLVILRLPAEPFSR